MSTYLEIFENISQKIFVNTTLRPLHTQYFQNFGFAVILTLEFEVNITITKYNVDVMYE